MSVARPPSHCPACSAPVKAYDNVPVLSWVWLRGRARCCGASISPRYPLVEVLGGVMAWAVLEAVVFQLPPETSAGRAVAIFGADLALALGLIAASFIDLEHLYIPDSISLGGTLLGFATASLRPPLTYVESATGAVLGFLLVWLPFDVLYQRIRKKTGMARGDAKLVMLAGAWFGWPGAVFALLAGSVQGTVAALIMLLFRGKIEDSPAIAHERERALAELAALPPEERAAFEKELANDPIFQPSEGALGARLAFGPFLALAILEFLLFGPILVSILFGFDS